MPEGRRVHGLVSAQEKAIALFEEVQARGLVAPGRGEREVSDLIRDLANEMCGTTKHWRERIVRSGPNTLLPYRETLPDRIVAAADIAFADFGPIFEEYEADFGRTYVFGDDPHEHRLLADLPRIFDAGRAHFAARAGRTCHWIIEFHRVDRERGFGGFYEQLLDLA
ncbi:M24 family metallopeptidase [Streptomyces sp. NPDC059752]|uniref:M24 family metallopeptidase n=1 Tax=unclassified Streptomyces TaxID=2593676 RepID=UPI0036656166